MHPCVPLAVVIVGSLSPRVAIAQSGAFGGQVVDAQAQIPLPWIKVYLLDGKNEILGSTLTDARGFFVIPHAEGGVFRLRFDRPGMRVLYGPVDTAAADSTLERRYELVFQEVAPDTVFTETDVEEKAKLINYRFAPKYPEDEEIAGKGGLVVLRFVVDSGGRIDLGSVKTLASTSYGFLSSVMDALPAMEFSPARIRGRAVSQVVEQKFQFKVRTSRRVFIIH